MKIEEMSKRLMEDLKYIKHQSTLTNQCVGIEDENYFAWIRKRSESAIRRLRKLTAITTKGGNEHE